MTTDRTAEPEAPQVPLFLCSLCEPHDGDRVYPADEMWWLAGLGKWTCRPCWQQWQGLLSSENAGPADQAPRLDRWLEASAADEVKRLQAEVDRLSALLSG